MKKHLTYANVMATLAFLIAVAGGTAYAANTVFSEDIVNGQVKAVDIGTGQVQSVDVKNEGLSGADIADQSGVDTCVESTRIGQLCFRAEDFPRDWANAAQHCANIGMRAPSLGEARELAQTHDLPGVDENEDFWTGDRYTGFQDSEVADSVTDAGKVTRASIGLEFETVCITNPTN